MTLQLPDVPCALRTDTHVPCPRRAEVNVHLVTEASGETVSRRAMCPVHAFEAVGWAFSSVDRPDEEPKTVIVTPLPRAGREPR